MNENNTDNNNNNNLKEDLGILSRTAVLVQKDVTF